MSLYRNYCSACQNVRTLDDLKEFKLPTRLVQRFQQPSESWTGLPEGTFPKARFWSTGMRHGEIASPWISARYACSHGLRPARQADAGLDFAGDLCGEDGSVTRGLPARKGAMRRTPCGAPCPRRVDGALANGTRTRTG